jgi:hypothetical protein
MRYPKNLKRKKFRTDSSHVRSTLWIPRPMSVSRHHQAGSIQFYEAWNQMDLTTRCYQVRGSS